MGFDGSIRIDAKLNNSALNQGVKDAERKIKSLQGAIDGVNISLIKQEATVKNARLRYEEAAAAAEKIREEQGESSAEFRRSAAAANTLYVSLTKSEARLSDLSAQSEALTSAMKAISESMQTPVSTETIVRQKDLQNAGDDIEKLRRLLDIVAKETARMEKLAPLDEEQLEYSRELGVIFGEILSKIRAAEHENFLEDKLTNAAGQARELSASIEAIPAQKIAEAADSFHKISDSVEEIPTQSISETAKNVSEVGSEASLTKDQVRALVKELARTETALVKQQPVVNALRQKYEEMASAAEKIAREKGVDSAQYQVAARDVDRMFKILNNAENRLDSLNDKAEAFRRALEIDDIPDYSAIAAGFHEIGDAAQTAAQSSFSAFRTLGSGIAKVASGVSSAAKNALSFAKSILHIGKNSRSASGGMDKLLKRVVRLGQAAFVFNILRKGLRQLAEDMKNVLMANAEFAASWNAIKVNLLTAFAPLWEVIEPAILTFMDLLARFTSVLAQLMATLFGKTYQQARDSAKALNQQAKSIDKAAASAKKALAPFDELNVLMQQGADSPDAETGLNFEAVETPDFSWVDELSNRLSGIADVFRESWDEYGQPLVDAFKRAAVKIKEALSTIWDTFAETWENHGKPVVDSFLQLWTVLSNIIADIVSGFIGAWEAAERGTGLIQSILDMLTAILNLLTSIGSAFREAWQDGTGESIMAHILEISMNLNNAVGELTDKIREAWDANGNGVAIWESILGFVDRILETINDMSFATLEWVQSLNLEPLTTAFRGLLESMEPFIDIALTGLEWVYTEILLPMSKWAIETAIPAVLDTLSNAFDLLSAALDVIKPGAEWIWNEFLVPIGKWVGTAFVESLKLIGDKFNEITAWIREDGEHINTVLTGIGKWLKFVWESIIRPTLDTVWGVLKSGFNLAFGSIKNLAQGIITTLSGIITFITGVFTGDWNKAWEGLKTVFKGIANFVIGIFEGMINGIITLINGAIGGLNKTIGLINLIPGVNISGIPSIPKLEIPRLAKGGIADSATIAMIGEKGREAVVPLENNTQWMDSLANKLAEKFYAAVHSAFLDALEQSGTIEDILTAILQGKEFIVDSHRLGRTAQKVNKGRSLRAGVTV